MRASLVVLFAIVAGTAATVVPGFLTGGGGGAGASASGRVPITMAVWGMPFEDRLFEDQYARKYEQIAPVVVDYQRHADIAAKYTAWHAKGEGIEVMRTGIDYYLQFVSRGMLEPLDAYINDPRFGLGPDGLDRFPARLIDRLRVDGKLYALPEDNAMYGLYFNRELFDLYNKAHPGAPLDYPSAAWDWSDVRRAAAALTGRRGDLFGPDVADPNGTVQGVDMVIWAWPFLNFFAQADGQLWSEDEQTTYIDSQAGVDAMLFMRDLIRDGSWKPTFGQDSGTGPSVYFPSGRVAMLYGGSWWVPKFENDSPSLDFSISPVPRGKVRAAITGSVLWAMSVHAPNKQAGWSMLHWLVQEPQADAYWDMLRVAPPANLKVLASAEFRSTKGLRDPADPSKFLIQPMPESKFPDRAAWMLDTWREDPQTGQAPGWIATGLYQDKLQTELQAMLQEYLRNPGTVGGNDGVDPQVALSRVARAVHSHIDAERTAKGLPKIERPARP